MRLFIVVILLVISNCAAYTQQYQFKHYTLEEGLPSGIIKSIAQDSSGYFWIATDEGIIKFDGVQFTSYRNALRSQYVKGFHTTREGRLLAFGDLDLIEIDNRIDTVRFKSLLAGARHPTDSTLWYPKAIYEDKNLNLWISEPQSVVRVRGTQMQRFSFGEDNRSPQFLRSFTCFEDLKGNLYTISIWGNTFRFWEDIQQFKPHPVPFAGQVWDTRVIGNHLYIATSKGVYQSQLLSEGGYSPPLLKYALPNVSCLKPIPDNQLVICTTGNQQFIAHLETNRLQQIPSPINNVNNAYLSTEQDLWLSSNEGVFIVQRNEIRNTSPVSDFIEAIAHDTVHEEIYFANMLNLYKLKAPVNYSDPPKLVLSLPDGYYQDLEVAHGGLWVANSFSVFFLKNDRITKEFKFEKDGRFVSDLYHDSKDQIWVSQHNQKSAIMIDSMFRLHRTRVMLKPGSNINTIREGPDGMYISSSGKDSYLFFKSDKDSLFRNISVPVPFDVTGDFNVTDLAFTDSIVWMATTEGIIRFDHKKLIQIDLGEIFTGLPVKAVEVYTDGSLLLASTKGLVRYDPHTSDYWLYDESTGLNSSTITTRGLLVDRNNRVWIGTARGLCYSEGSLIKKKRTLRPRIISFKINGLPVRFTEAPLVPYGSFVSLTVSSISFPENKVHIQYRVNDDEKWHTVTSSTINLSDLKSGRYKVHIRAKKAGGLDWSTTTQYQFDVMLPFWQQGWFLLTCTLALTLIVFFTIALVNMINTRRRIHLQQLIDERTNELKLSNEELSQRNTELDRFVYSASHDLSAPLKSVLGLITIARMDNPSEQTRQYLTMMENSVRKLESFISDVVNYSRNTRLEINYQPISFRTFIESVWSDYQYIPETKKIRFEIIDETTEELITDEVRLRIIFNNLVSNAIKFHQTSLRTDPFLKITLRNTPDYFVFTIEDNGQGIPEELQARIFDMFFRATQNAPGSGLGLYILKETILKLHGSVSVHSKLGDGTLFIIQLPRKNKPVS